jgi:carbohydrate-selective porin OprB
MPRRAPIGQIAAAANCRSRDAATSVAGGGNAACTRGRAEDFVAVAVVYGEYAANSAAMNAARDFEMTIEATYGLKLLPGFVLQPDVQYLVHPSGRPEIPNALAIGLNVIVIP